MSKALLCVTVTAPTTAELRRRRDEVSRADLVELRLDSVSDPDVAGALAGRRVPVIVTCRPEWEGGHFRGSEEERHRLLSEAIARGAEYVDLEWRARFDDLVALAGGRRIVLSAHDFDGVPADLAARAQAMKTSGAAVIKIAAQTRSLSDCVPLLDLGAQMGRAGGLVVIGMGEAGLATRVLAAKFGSMWTYAGTEAHVGQLTPEILNGQYRYSSLTDTTDVYGLVGLPIGHSVSPAMHNAAFEAARRDAVYLPFPAASANDFVRFARALGLKGASITIPYKVAMLDQVDEVYSVARRIGAINTISVVDGRWIGGNTDAAGFLQPLQGIVPLQNAAASILGAGGSARAVAVALASAGARVRVHARNTDRARDVALLAGGEVGPWPPAPASWDLLVNCTPIGMHPHVDDTPVSSQLLTGATVYDLIYNPQPTRLLREAQQAGCNTIGGLDMLVGQAQEQFQWWTGVKPPSGVMRAAAIKRLGEFAAHEHHVV
jgi:3-dehydroquinate dehydratase/shikimate dehydrogenase